MKRTKSILFALLMGVAAMAANPYDNPDTIFVARDGTGEFRNVGDAVEVCRAFMDYNKVIFVKNGTYKEKIIIPSWLDNIEIVGEDVEKTIITFDDHANIRLEGTEKGMGTFRTYTMKIEGNGITLKNITIENNSARLGQAVALHTEGDRLKFIGCRFLGHQDTVYTGKAGTRLYFEQCYIEGTYIRNGGKGQLTDIRYVRLQCMSGIAVTASTEGIFDLFLFQNLTDQNGTQISTDYVKQWNWLESTSQWQYNSEFTPSGNTQTVNEYKSAMIMLVLDCSSSLGSDFVNMKTAANGFIETLSGNYNGR